jgi:hypothetical protein
MCSASHRLLSLTHSLALPSRNGTDRKMVSHRYHANRPLSLLLEGQSIQRETVVTTLQTPLQPRTNKSGTRRTNARRGDSELDNARARKPPRCEKL